MVYCDLHESETSIIKKASTHPYFKFLVCDSHMNKVIGYVDSKDLLNSMLANQSMILSRDMHICSAIIVSDTLMLSEALKCFKTADADFAVILNKYALVVVIVTINDIMTTLMEDLVGQS